MSQEDQDKRAREMIEKAIEDRRLSAPSAGSQAASCVSNPNRDEDFQLESVPRNQRRGGTMGNLGEPASKDALLERAKKAMTDVNFDHARFVSEMIVIAPYKLAMLNIVFDKPERISELRELLYKANIKFPGAQGAVWVNIQTSRKERQPSRMINRAADFLTMLEEEKDPPVLFEKKHREKQIWISGTRTPVFYVMSGVPKPTRWMRDRYGDEQTELCIAHCIG